MLNKLSALALLTLVFLGGCGTDEEPVAEDTQNPPTTASALEAWLDKGFYKSWAGESSVHAARSPSPHGLNRVYSNAILSAHGAGNFPVDSAGVKELYNDAGTEVVGIAVYRKVSAENTGDAWYWYERVPLDHPAPHDAAGVVADGRGGSGPALQICVSCHAGAGSDAEHSGHDFVYTQVR